MVNNSCSTSGTRRITLVVLFMNIADIIHAWSIRNRGKKVRGHVFVCKFFNNVIYFIQMLATINTPKVQAPFGVSLLHLVLIIQGYNQNYMKYIYNLNTISI